MQSNPCTGTTVVPHHPLSAPAVLLCSAQGEFPWFCTAPVQKSLQLNHSTKASYQRRRCRCWAVSKLPSFHSAVSSAAQTGPHHSYPKLLTGGVVPTPGHPTKPPVPPGLPSKEPSGTHHATKNPTHLGSLNHMEIKIYQIPIISNPSRSLVALRSFIRFELIPGYIKLLQ